MQNPYGWLLTMTQKTGNDVEFITNNFMIGALEVTNLYRQVGYWGFLQVDKSEYCIEDLVGIFWECSTYSPMGCHYCVSDNRQNQSRLKKSVFNHWSGYVDKNLCTQKSWFERPHHQGKGLNHSKQKCQRNHFVWWLLITVRFFIASVLIGPII